MTTSWQFWKKGFTLTEMGIVIAIEKVAIFFCDHLKKYLIVK